MQVSIALGKSRKTKVWKNEKWDWEKLAKRLSETGRTLETYKEYSSYGKEKQSEIKDHGGFVGGYLKEGKRSPGTVTFRSVLTLDLDLATYDFWDDFTMTMGWESVLHSTHKHSKKTPRYRLVMPINRPVDKDEYEAIGRKIASILDINLFDPTTFQPERLMYWPTTSKDGEWVCYHQTGQWLDADRILKSYVDWKDISEWPKLDSEDDEIFKSLKLQGDPNEKPGLIGAFCRTYTIADTIATFLPDLYEETGQDDRYTYTGGSGASGAIVYDEKFLYSHHSTDPAHGKLLNAFDLVRIHKYGHEDNENGAKDIQEKKSHKLMSAFASQDKDVLIELGTHRTTGAMDFDEVSDFEDDEKQPVDKTWYGNMEITDKGKYKNTINNFYLALINDPKLKDRLYYNEFSHRECARLPLPWRKGKGLIDFTNEDDASLRHYLEHHYEMYHVSKSSDAISAAFHTRRFHPIRDYINALTWDGTPRLDEMMIEYLGADDTTFTRLATRKALVAAVKRIYEPGCKFDYVLVLVGRQGIKKSMIFNMLGKEWFSDSFTGVQGKEAYEQLQGVWIMEIAELAGIKRADVEPVKHFIAKREDMFRVAYGKRPEKFPRQGVFFGTTNEENFLRDQSGNRRYWPIKVSGYGFSDVDDLPVDQIWAEAKMFYDQGEKVYFDVVGEEDAKAAQLMHMEIDDRTGLIHDFLFMLLPEDWETMDIGERRTYIHHRDPLQKEGTVKRFAVSVAEIWTELLRGDPKEMGPHNTKYIHNILNNIEGWEKGATLTFPIYGKQTAYQVKNVKLSSATKRRAERVKP